MNGSIEQEQYYTSIRDLIARIRSTLFLLLALAILLSYSSFHVFHNSDFMIASRNVYDINQFLEEMPNRNKNAITYINNTKHFMEKVDSSISNYTQYIAKISSLTEDLNNSLNLVKLYCDNIGSIENIIIYKSKVESCSSSHAKIKRPLIDASNKIPKRQYGDFNKQRNIEILKTNIRDFIQHIEFINRESSHVVRAIDSLIANNIFTKVKDGQLYFEKKLADEKQKMIILSGVEIPFDIAALPAMLAIFIVQLYLISLTLQLREFVRAQCIAAVGFIAFHKNSILALPIISLWVIVPTIAITYHLYVSSLGISWFNITIFLGNSAISMFSFVFMIKARRKFKL